MAQKQVVNYESYEWNEDYETDLNNHHQPRKKPKIRNKAAATR